MMELTKERLMALSNRENVCAICSDEIVAMARQLLAGLEQEPVAWIVHTHGGNQLSSDASYVANAERFASIRSTSLYAAPQLPQPVVVSFDEWSRKCDLQIALCDPELREKARYIWDEACRAAMLQGADGEPTDDERIMAIEGIIPSADLSEANAQGWIPCSERMPEQFKAILVFNEYGEVWSGAYDRYWNFYCDNELVECVTHWMPLPAAPQQEVK